MFKSIVCGITLMLLSVSMLTSSLNVYSVKSRDDLLFEMEVNKTVMTVGESIVFSLTLTNIGENNVTITFTPPFFDLCYCTSEGCFQWSDGKAFIQVILDLILEPGENYSETLHWNLYQYVDDEYRLPEPGIYSLFGICYPIGLQTTESIPITVNPILPSLETDKHAYKLGENVTITLTNIGNEIVEIGGYPAWQILTFPEDEPVYPEVFAFLAWSLEPGENDTYTWNQYNQFDDSFCRPGKYIIKDTQGWGLSTYFEIFNAEIIVPDDFLTIQEAVNNANEEDTVFVRNGTYYENVVVNKTVSLVGENKNTIINGGNATKEVLSIQVDNVSARGFKIVSQNGNGIVLSSSSNSEVRDNTISCGLGTGIIVAGGSNNSIVGNDIASCTSYGIIVENSHNNLVTKNTMNAHVYSIWLVDADFNYVFQNRFGIHWSIICVSLYWSSNNTIEGNTLYDSGYQESPHIELLGSNSNLIFHNTFLGFSCGVYIAEDSVNNVWDNGCEGNYWCDYDGIDSDGDGIGDTPYIIDEDNLDNYPLMNPYWNPADVDHDLDVDLYDAVRVLLAYGSKLGDENYNPHCDINEPYGTINLYDAILVLVAYGKEYR